MRLLIDASAAVNQGAGIGRYARELIPRLALSLPDADLLAVVAPDPGANDAVTALGYGALQRASIRTRTLPVSRRWADILWYRARLPLVSELYGGRRDLIYSPDFTAPPSVRGRSIVTVHDLAFEVVPEYAPAGLRTYLQHVVPRQVNRASAIAVVSRTTARDLHERYQVPHERMSLVSNGVDDRFFHAQPLRDEDRQALQIPDDYLLMVGTLEPRKNHLNAIEAAVQSETGREVPLVIAGRRGWADDDIVARIRELTTSRSVIWLQYVPERLLPSLYAGALATIYPSWYEGFGLPALESLATGTPLVISRAPSLLEIAQGVARDADAADVDALAEAIDASVSTDRTDAARQARRQRAESYRWDTAGEALVNLVQRTLA